MFILGNKNHSKFPFIYTQILQQPHPQIQRERDGADGDNGWSDSWR